MPLAGEDWLRVGDADAGRMAERVRLLAALAEVVPGLRPEGWAAAAELHDPVPARQGAAAGQRIADGSVVRPDGVAVPLATLSPAERSGRALARL